MTVGLFHFWRSALIVRPSHLREGILLEQNNEVWSIITTGTQATMWEDMRRNGEAPLPSPFSLTPEEEKLRRKIAQHRAWLASFPHECPSPYNHYRIGVYIRYFNQTKYSNYLDYHKQQFIDTIRLCPNWSLVDFYVDDGQTAPNMESAGEWCRLLEDCFAGKVDLIITQKVTNISRKPEDLTLISRLLATMPRPIGIYFISEDIFTLASYYLDDLRDRNFIPSGWVLLPDDEQEEYLECEKLLEGGVPDAE